MEMNMCIGFCELNEEDMYAIDGGALDPLTGQVIKESIKVLCKAIPWVGAIVLTGVAVGFVYEMVAGE